MGFREIGDLFSFKY